MVVATERVARRFEAIVADVSIPVDFPAFEAADVYVYYGTASLVAVQNTDYTVTLDEDNFDTFEVTPTPSLLTKINALITADPVNESNFIVVRRTMNFLTDASDGSVRDLRFLAREFDRTAMRFAQLGEELSRAVKLGPRFTSQSAVIDELVEGASLIYQSGKIIAGPVAVDVANAQQYALDAQAARVAAEVARDEAEAKENSMMRDRGPWLTGILYSPSDTFDDGGNVYMTNTTHFATNIAADISAGRIRLWVQKGATGPGSGDLLSTQNLSELTDKPLAYANIGGRAVGKVDLLPFSLVDPAVVITDIERLFANKGVNTAFPTAKAVAESHLEFLTFADLKTAGIDGGTFTAGAWQTRTIGSLAYNGIPGASLASNLITLPEGEYHCHISCPANRVGLHKSRLYDATNSTVKLQGTSEKTSTGVDTPITRSIIDGIFEVFGAPLDVRVEHICQTTFATSGFGQAANFVGNAEVYTRGIIRRVG